MKIRLGGQTGRTGRATLTVGRTDYDVNVKFHGNARRSGGWESYKWKVRIKRRGSSGRAASFDYYTGLGCSTDEFDFNDFAGCITSDSDYAAQYGPNGYRSFAEDAGYEDLAQATTVYDGCKDTYDKLVRVFGVGICEFFRMFREE